MQKLMRLFLKGLTAVLPAALTLYVLWWLGTTFESLLGGLARRLLGESAYRPGMGLVLGVLLVLGVGLLLDLWVVRRVARAMDRVIGHVPLVKSIYGSLQDMMGFFRGGEGSDMGQPVLVTVDDKQLVGFVTRRDAAQAFPGAAAGQVAVYVPMSYQLGGFVVLMEEAQLQPLEMPVEQAMRTVLTAGIGGQEPADEARPA